MREEMEYGRGERIVLWAVAVAGLVGMNGAFIHGMTQPDLVRRTLENPLALAFVAEAFVLMGVLAWLLTKWGTARLRWPWFVGLSLLGSMAFALPAVLLWPGGRAELGRAEEGPEAGPDEGGTGEGSAGERRAGEGGAPRERR